MTISQTLQVYKNTDTDLILEHVLKKPKEFLYTHPEKQLTASQLKTFKALVARRKKGEPVAYLLGYKDFFGLRFKVTKDTLIPRPETEWVVEHVLKQKLPRGTKILDLGTGSGCIAISIKKKAPKLSISAVDVSKKALTMAKRNAQTHKTKIGLVHSNLLSNLKNRNFDIIIANLPYLASDWKSYSKESIGLKYEPKQALYTKEKGLYLYRKLLKQISALNQKPSTVFLEFDPRQKVLIEALIRKILPKSKTIFHKDLGGHFRYVQIIPN